MFNEFAFYYTRPYSKLSLAKNKHFAKRQMADGFSGKLGHKLLLVGRGKYHPKIGRI